MRHKIWLRSKCSNEKKMKKKKKQVMIDEASYLAQVEM